MDKYFLNTGTVTKASRGRDILRQNSISAYVQAARGNLATAGCGFGIVVTGRPDKAVRILQNASVAVLSVTPMGK